MLRQAVFLSLIALLAAAGSARADDSARLDFSAWRQMPVFDRGRLMPLDTFARSVVRKICGRTCPTLDPSGLPEGSQVRQLFPEGKPREFDPAELLFGWLVEPEKWEPVPFLIAQHKDLREDLLELPITDKNGRRLKHVSPRQVGGARRFHRKVDELRQRRQAQGEEYRPSRVEKEVDDLVAAYNLYRMLTSNPLAPGSPRGRFFTELVPVAHGWPDLEENLRQARRPNGRQDSSLPVAQVGRDVQRLVLLVRQEEFAVEDADRLLAALRDAAAELAEEVEADCRQTFRDASAGPGERAKMNELASRTAELAQHVEQLYSALYDHGPSLRLVPVLDPAVLRLDREPDDDNQPWLSFQTLLHGSKALLREYPQGELQRVREAFRRAKAAYTDRTASDRAGRFARAIEEFAVAVRALGEKIEPQRRKLDIPGTPKDKAAVLAATAYPPPGYTDTELRYNRADPFLWSWVICLLSTVCLGLAFGVLRKPMFWLGILAIVVAQGAIIYGLVLRAIITGWVPVTNMFETIVFVGLVVAMLGTWFTLLPLSWPGLKLAWRMAAVPANSTLETIALAVLVVAMLLLSFVLVPSVRPEIVIDWRVTAVAVIVCYGLYGLCCRMHKSFRTARANPNGGPIAERAVEAGKPSRMSTANWVLLPPQLYLMAWGFCALCIEHYGSGGESPIIRLWPKTDAGSWVPSSISAVLAWAAGLCVLAPTLWYGPRTALVFVLSLGTVAYGWVKQGAGEAIKEVLRRKLYVTVGAAAGFLFCLLAYNWPADEQRMGGMQAVIRDNFWLSVHVLSITASYGAAALAWGLANISLTYYLFGRYREPAGPAQSPPEGKDRTLARRPPEACATLADYTYRAIQAAFLLLAVGTILGALWADVAWGRFWSWDPKEVWALVSLLAYAIILHSRYAGWSGDFGFAVGAMLGATCIVMAWYGVNYLLGSGLHTYGGGSGGKWYVIIAASCNWIFVAVAAVRYNVETSRREDQQPAFTTKTETRGEGT